MITTTQRHAPPTQSRLTVRQNPGQNDRTGPLVDTRSPRPAISVGDGQETWNHAGNYPASLFRRTAPRICRYP